MKHVLKMLVPVTVGLIAMPALAEFKLGFVNAQRVVQESPQAKRVADKMRKDFEKREQELQQMSKRLQTLQENLEKNGVTMAESERRNKEREFAELNRDFQRKQREFNEDLNLRRNEEMAAIFDRANKVVKQIAEAEKFDLIVQEAVYFSPRIDLTDRVIKALGDAAATPSASGK